MKTLYILNYNNYFNRLVKYETSLLAYLSNVVQALPGANFVPGDGVDATHTFGNTAYSYDGSGDYLLVLNPETNEIESRWFILEKQFTCAGQWILSLRRDVIVDYLQIVADSPLFLEKGSPNTESPLILNQEAFTSNQIKTNELLLKDRSGCAWLVGYLSSEQSIEGITVDSTPDVYKENIGAIAQWKFYTYSNLSSPPTLYKNSFAEMTIAFNFFHANTSTRYAVFYHYDSQTYDLYKFESQTNSANYIQLPNTSNIEPKQRVINFMSQLISNNNYQLNYTNLMNNLCGVNYYQGNMQDYEGKIIQDTISGKVYSCSVSNDNVLRPQMNQAGVKTYTTFQESSYGRTRILNAVKLYFGLTDDDVDSVRIQYYAEYNQTSLNISEQTSYSATFNLAISKARTEDVYRIICIPFPDVGKEFQFTSVIDDDGETEIGTIRMTREVSLSIANQIMRKGGGSGANTLVYDFQLLPYCPVLNSYMWGINPDGDAFISMEGDSPAVGHYTPVSNIGVVLEVKNPIFTFNITDAQYKIDITDKKVQNQLDMWRLCSPNYASVFEFNAAKNNGVQFWNVDCHYKPYQPYIHVNPNFQYLYGSRDFNDTRGLICSGDFSLTSLNDAFTNYTLQNKNYQLAFDRSVENLDINQKYQKVGDVVNAVVGTVGGTTGGAFAGNMVAPGPIGTIVGGLAGGVASAAGGIADVKINERLRKEQRDYMIDQFNYSLENIKAQPSTLTKVTALNNNNKIYPVLEFYTCTPEEKQAFLNKLQYEGMSLSVIGKIGDYLNPIQALPLVDYIFVKGTFVRLPSTALNEDYHLAITINSELERGVYFNSSLNL